MIHTVEFIKSASSPSDFINDGRPVVVFAGRSNVGKSSVINTILGRRSAARVSSTPGKTAHVNYFLIDNRLHFADIPGYGYARVSQSERDRWDYLMQAFFDKKEAISMGVLIVDIRHEPTTGDSLMADILFSSGYRSIVVANKSDKLKSSEIAPALKVIRQSLELGEDIRLIPFSAKEKLGKDDLEKEIFRSL